MSTVIIILINFLKFEVKKKNNNEGHEWLKKNNEGHERLTEIG